MSQGLAAAVFNANETRHTPRLVEDDNSGAPLL